MLRCRSVAGNTEFNIKDNLMFNFSFFLTAFSTHHKDISTTFFGAFPGIIGTSLSLVTRLKAYLSYFFNLVCSLYIVILLVLLISLNGLVFGLLVFHQTTFMLYYTISLGALLLLFSGACLLTIISPQNKMVIWAHYNQAVCLILPVLSWLMCFLVFGFIFLDTTSVHAGSKPSTALVPVEPLDPVVKRTGSVALPGKNSEGIPNNGLPGKHLQSNPNNGASTGGSWSAWFWSWFGFPGTKPAVVQIPSLSVPADQPVPAASWSSWFWSFFGYSQPTGKATPLSSPMAQTTGPAMSALAGLSSMIAVIPPEVPAVTTLTPVSSPSVLVSEPLESQSLELVSLASQLKDLRLLWLPHGFLELVTYGEHSCIIIGLDANKPQEFCVVPLYLTLSALKLNSLSFLSYDPITGSLAYNMADHTHFTASVTPSPHELINDEHLTDDQRAEVLLCYQYYLNLAQNQPNLFLYLQELLYNYNAFSLSVPLFYEVVDNLASRAVVHQIDCSYIGESNLSDPEDEINV